jgi:hypothetical protein
MSLAQVVQLLTQKQTDALTMGLRLISGTVPLILKQAQNSYQPYGVILIFSENNVHSITPG